MSGWRGALLFTVLFTAGLVALAWSAGQLLIGDGPEHRAAGDEFMLFLDSRGYDCRLVGGHVSCHSLEAAPVGTRYLDERDRFTPADSQSVIADTVSYSWHGGAWHCRRVGTGGVQCWRGTVPTDSLGRE